MTTPLPFSNSEETLLQYSDSHQEPPQGKSESCSAQRMPDQVSWTHDLSKGPKFLPIQAKLCYIQSNGTEAFERPVLVCSSRRVGLVRTCSLRGKAEQVKGGEMKMLFARWNQDLLRNLGGVALVALLPFLLPLQAQESDSSETDIEEETQVAEDDKDSEDVSDQREETLVVTGSRLARDEFSSISPLQIIDAETSREAGLIDASEAIQESTTASGAQIDLTFNGYVLDDGPGASTANLRGLGADRTLILVNGRRVAPAGVEGAPSNPDLNLLMPLSLIQRFEILGDGASSIYGSDAIAGVVNVILREDFDGFEVDVSYSLNQFSRIGETTTTMSWGYNLDRGFVGVGASLQDSPEVTLNDVAFRGACDRHVERDQTGALRHKDAYFESVAKMKVDDCRLGLLTSRAIMGPYGGGSALGSIYYTEGQSNIGIPNFSDAIWPVPRSFHLIDRDNDGWTDINYRDYSLNGHTGHRSFYPEVSRNNVMAYGEYTLPGDFNLTPFFELQWGQREIRADRGEGQLFPWVPGNNPFNPCNPNAEGGSDCVLGMIEAAEYFHSIQSVRDDWLAAYGLDPIPGGSCDQYFGQFGLTCALWWLGSARGALPGQAIDMRPIVSIRGDRNITSTDVTQTRWVMGASFDLPFLDGIGPLSGWSGQLEGVFSRALGVASREGIREDRLNYALGWYNAAGIPCHADSTAPNVLENAYELTPDVTDGCVPINLFARSVYVDGEEVVGEFTTQAERDYVFDSRDFDTQINQDLISFYISGALLDLPAGTMQGSYGFEWREDEIISTPDDVAADGLFFGFFVDKGATGTRTISEHFTEIEIPLLEGDFLAHELTLNVSGRLTKDEFFDSASTWSAKIGWRPNADWLFRSTAGTSYRTPNLRNLFLAGQTGFLTVFDPCLIPNDALDPDGTYLPENDMRDAVIKENCLNAGVDPTKAHNFGNNQYSVEVDSGGAATSLLPEDANSQTFGIVWEQPFTNAFDFRLAWTYYEIEVEKTIINPPLGFILYDCYGFRDGDPIFCDRISRLDNPATEHFDFLIDTVDTSFINRDLERTRGFDYNVGYRQQITVFDQPLQVDVFLTTHRLLERFSLFLESSDDPIEINRHSDWYYPRWRHALIVGLQMYDWGAAWSTRVIGPQGIDPVLEDDFASAFDDDFSDTCLGPPDDLLCRDVEDAPRYYEHSFSLNYRGPRMFMGLGISNVLNTKPPLVNGSYVNHLNNHPIGTGYDMLGRSFFLNFSYAFSGQ